MVDFLRNFDEEGLQRRILGGFADLLERQGPLVDTMPSTQWPGPLSLQTGNFQLFPQAPLVTCSNRPVGRAVLALWALCREMHVLSAEMMSLVSRIRLYDAGLFDEEAVSFPEAVARAARILPSLDCVRLAKTRCRCVLHNTLQQVGRLYASQNSAIAVFNSNVVLEHVGKLLSAVAQLDLAILAGVTIRRHWSLYEKCVHSEVTAVRDTHLNKLNQMVKALRREVLSAGFFSFIVRGLETLKCDSKLNFTSLVNELNSNLVHVFQSMESCNCCDGDKVMSVVCLFVLMCRVTEKCDSRMWAHVISLHRRMPAVALKHGLFWQIDQFLAENISHLTGKKLQPCLPAIVSWLNRCHQTLRKELLDLQKRFCRVTSAVYELVLNSSPKCSVEVCSSPRICDLLVESDQLLKATASMCCQLLEAHTAVGMAIPTDIANQVCCRIELVKSLENVFSVHAVEMLKLASFDRRSVQILLISALNEARQSVVKRVASDRQDVDVLTALDLAVATLKGPVTSSSLVAVRVCLSLCTNRHVLSGEQWSRLSQLISRLYLLAAPLVQLSEASDCRFVFWRLAVLTPFLKQSDQRPDLTCRIRALLSAVAADSAHYLSAVSGVDSRRIGVAYDRQVAGIVDKHLMGPTMKRVEHLLRVDIHPDLLLSERPCPLLDGLKFTRGLLEVDSFSGVMQSLSLSETAANRLERVFYELGAVSNHDVCKYAEMRHLARRVYALPLNGCELPLHGLDRGIDLLAVARDLPRFVSRHHYHIFSQIFTATSNVEAGDCRAVSARGAVVLSPNHAAAWLRVHGPGVADTLVNAVYQLLRQQLGDLSRLLSAERLVARMSRAAPLMHAAVQQADGGGDQLFRLAEQLGSAVATKMGRRQDGATPMHVLAELLGRIGSALGLIRVIHSGLLRCFSDADQFMLLSDDKVTENWCQSSLSLSCQSRLSVTNAVSYVSSMRASADWDYCVVVVETLARSLQTPGHAHLQHMHALVPPLLLHLAGDAYCGSGGACVTRSAVVLGVTFLLAALGQRQQFAALHWPRHVHECLKAQIREGESLSRHPSQTPDAGLSNTALMTVERLQRNYRRHMQLNSAMSAAWLVLRPV